MSMKVSAAELSHNAREDKFMETERRPPALGEEEHDFSSTRSSMSNQSQVSAASGKSAGDGSCGVHVASITPRKSMLGIGMATMGCGEGMSSLKDMSDEPPMGYEPEGSAATTPPFTETSTPPAYLKWAESLRGLLDDQEGTELFRTYLMQEQCLDSLDFWFACNGLRKKSDENEIQMIIRAIYNKYVRSSSTLSMAPETRKVIKRKVQSKSGLNQTIFDRAQAEVEASMSSTTYPNFLRSDLYVQFVQGVQNGGVDSPKLSDSGGGCSGSSSVSGGTRPAFGYLPTVDENKELHVAAPNPLTPVGSSTLPLTQHYLCVTQQKRAGYGYRRSEAPASHYLQQSTTPLAHPYHAMYASCVPVSAQDSELQSLSSDAHTDDTMSLTDGSVDGMPAFPSKKYLRQQHHVMRQNASQNREVDPSHNFMPRTLRIPHEQMTPMEPIKFAAILIDKLEKVAREREIQERLHERLHYQEMEEAAVSTAKQLPPDEHLVIALPAGVLKMSITDELDHQSILDKHVDSLWNEDSPRRTPPRRRSPDRRRASAPPAVPVMSGVHPSKGPGLAYPGSHHRHRREQDLVSTFSSDSGMVHDYADAEFALPPSTLPLVQEPPTSGVVPPYHHKLGTKSKVSPKSPSTVLPEMSDVNARVGGYPHEPYVLPDTNLDRERRPKESSRRSSNKKMSAADSSSSCVDSGVSTAYETSLPNLNTIDRVRSWIEGNEKYASSHHADSEKDSSTRHRKSSYSSMSATSPVANRPGRVKKPVAYNTSRSGSLDRGGNPGVWVQPSQPLAQDPSMPMLPPPNTTTQLEEARRRLEDDSKAKLNRNKPGPCSKDKVAYIEVQKSRTPLCKGATYLSEIQEESAGTMRKSHKYSASLPSTSNAPPASVVSENEYTVVGYYFCGDSVPFKTQLPGTNITLRQFKTLINTKKGNFRFFFKKASDEFGTGVVKEEISDDNQILPLWDGKIFAVVETVD